MWVLKCGTRNNQAYTITLSLNSKVYGYLYDRWNFRDNGK